MKTLSHNYVDVAWTSNTCHGHDFHHRDLKFSDIVPDTITIFKHNLKKYKYLITSGMANTVKGRSFHTQVWASRKHLANWAVLHLDTSNSNEWAAATALVCRTLRAADRNSLNKEWFKFEWTLYNIHSAATWRWHNDKKLWSGQCLVTKYTRRKRSWRWHSAADLHNKGTILNDLENKCIVVTKQHRGVHKDTLHQPQNTNSLRDTRDNTAQMVFACCQTSRQEYRGWD